jgi:hypothetical protein
MKNSSDMTVKEIREYAVANNIPIVSDPGCAPDIHIAIFTNRWHNPNKAKVHINIPGTKQQFKAWLDK